jgi:hypothetical protein
MMAAPGNVYCFNCYNEPVEQLNVNGVAFGSVTPAIGGWAATGGTIYTPLSVPVPRSKHGDGNAATFPNDMSTPLRINWDSWTVQTDIDISKIPNLSLNDDLILYIAINQLTLMNTRGFVLLTKPVSPAGQTPKAVAELKEFRGHH